MSAFLDVRLLALSVMALKVAAVVGGAAKAVLRPALLCRPWEVRRGSGQRDSRSARWAGPETAGLRSVLEPDWLWAPRGAGSGLRAGVDWLPPLSVKGLAKVDSRPTSPGVCILRGRGELRTGGVSGQQRVQSHLPSVIVGALLRRSRVPALLVLAALGLWFPAPIRPRVFLWRTALSLTPVELENQFASTPDTTPQPQRFL